MIALISSCNSKPEEIECVNCESIARQQFLAKNYDSLLVIGDSMIKSDPGNIHGYEARGMALHYLDKDSLALKALSHAVMMGANEAEIYFCLARTEERLGDTLNAIADYEIVLQKNPNHQTALVNRALLVGEDLPEVVVRNLQNAIDSDPQNIDNYNSVGHYYYKNGNHDSALIYYNRGFKVGDLIEMRYNRGIVYYHREKFDSAIVDFTLFLDSFPQHSECYRWRAYCYGQSGDFSKFCEDMNRSASLGNENAKQDLIRHKCKQ